MARKKKQQAPDDDVRVVSVDMIRMDDGTQSRARNDPDTVAEYAAMYQAAVDAGSETPYDVLPDLECVLSADGSRAWPTDGFHRLLGAGDAGLTEVRVRVALVGTVEDARWLALSANLKHGLKRTNADKRHVVEMAFALERTRGMSNRAIALHCGVGESLVRDVRDQVREKRTSPTDQVESVTTSPADQVSSDDTSRRTGLDGKSYPGGKKKAEPEAPTPMPWDLTGEESAEDDHEPPALSDEEQQAVGERLIRDAHAEPSPSPRKPKAEKPRQEEVRDAVGNLVPSRLRDVFADAKLSAELARVRAWRQAVEHASFHRNLGAVEAHYRPWLKPGVANEAAAEAHAQLTAAEQHVERALPYALCPHCLETAGGCDACRGTGWVPRWRHEELEQQATLTEGKAS